MLTLLKIYLNIADTSQDTLLNTLLDDASCEFIAITNQPIDRLSDAMERIIVQMAIVKYNRLGTQHLESESYSSSSEKFRDGYSKQLRNRINAYKRLKAL